MALFDYLSGAVTAFDDYVGDFLGNITSSFGFSLSGFEDIFSGAITNAAVTAINGGDIGKAALFGAAGGALGSSNLLGSYSNDLGAAISGYGLAEANDANGLMGALSGAGGQFLKDRMTAAPSTTSTTGGGGSTGSGGTTTTYGPGGTPTTTTHSPTGAPAASAPPSPTMSALKDLLVTKDGEASLLGKALLGGGKMIGDQMVEEDKMEQQQEYAIERAEKQAEIDHKAEQARIKFFSDQQNPYRIVRRQ